jgi:hypothetical protein
MKCPFYSTQCLLCIISIINPRVQLALANQPEDDSARVGSLRGGIGYEANAKAQARDSQDQKQVSIADDLRHRSLNELFEGDIVPDYDTISEAYGHDLAEELVEEGILDPPPAEDDGLPYDSIMDRRWTIRVNDVVHVPYVFDSDYSAAAKKSMTDNIMELGDRTKVVKFVPRTNQVDYLLIKPIRGCSSNVGKQGGEQKVSLAGYCIYNKGVTQHEMLHALGLFHEQSRPDRDNYVTINTENIQEGKEHNFDKKTISKTYGNEYDYGSVMHYPTNAFNKNGRDTITPTRPLNGKIIGQRTEADAQDILDIRLLYQCVSGPRNLAEYDANHCNTDCKCWKNEIGCNGNNDACQGSLTCSNNKCVGNDGNSNGNGNNKGNGNGNSTGNGNIGSGNQGETKKLQIKNLCLSVARKLRNNVTAWGCTNAPNRNWTYDPATKRFKSKISNSNGEEYCLAWNTNTNNVFAEVCNTAKKSKMGHSKNGDRVKIYDSRERYRW